MEKEFKHTLMPRKIKPILIVLSGGLTEKGRLPFFVKNRLDHAYKCFMHGLGDTIVVSGKWSYLYEDIPEKTEAAVMIQHLKALGMQDKDILSEHTSQDLISSAYYIKTHVIIPHKYQHVRIITSDFQEERARFVFKKIFGENYNITVDCTPANLSAKSMWSFFTYESEALVNTKKFLRLMKTGDHEYLKNKFYSSAFYKLQRVGHTRKLAREGEITRRKNVNIHYSLRQIYKTREMIFESHSIAEMQKKTLKADFWSGVFLNFLGKNSTNDLYCLKFVLYVKDRKAFLNEIKITEYITKQAFSFVPKAIASQTNKAPYWYMYKVVKGSMSGNFSLDFSYRDTFFKEKYPSILAKQLMNIRHLDISHLDPIICNSSWYHKNNRGRIGVIQQDKTLLEKHPIVFDTHSILERAVTKITKYAKHPAHNDLHPANMIYSGENRVYFIDFERMGYNTIATDFARIYSLSWPNPFFQREFYKEFINTLTKDEKYEFDEIFSYAYIYMLLLLLKYTVQWKYLSDKTRRKEVRKYIYAELEKAKKSISESRPFFS